MREGALTVASGSPPLRPPKGGGCRAATKAGSLTARWLERAQCPELLGATGEDGGSEHLLRAHICLLVATPKLAASPGDPYLQVPFSALPCCPISDLRVSSEWARVMAVPTKGGPRLSRVAASPASGAGLPHPPRASTRIPDGDNANFLGCLLPARPRRARHGQAEAKTPGGPKGATTTLHTSEDLLQERGEGGGHLPWDTLVARPRRLPAASPGPSEAGMIPGGGMLGRGAFRSQSGSWPRWCREVWPRAPENKHFRVSPDPGPDLGC